MIEKGFFFFHPMNVCASASVSDVWGCSKSCLYEYIYMLEVTFLRKKQTSIGHDGAITSHACACQRLGMLCV